MNPLLRRIALAASGVVLLGLLGWVGYVLTENSRATAEKVSRFARTTDLKSLDAAARADALRKLEELINRLPLEERRKWRMGGAWKKWFDDMTETEKGQFIEATMPSGFKQWLGEFDALPANDRKKFIDSLSAQLKETHQLATDREPGLTNSMYGTNLPPQLTVQLEGRAQTIGLRTYFTESSAETKAELAPFLEEIQREMQQSNQPPTLTR